MRPRILLVNDQQATIDAVAAVLSERGYDVTGRLTDHVAVDDVLRLQPQLIIIDGLSPTTPQAIEFMQLVWLTPTTGHIPFIVTTTASPRLQAMHGVLQAKGIRIVVKPYRPDVLLTCVQAAMEHPPPP